VIATTKSAVRDRIDGAISQHYREIVALGYRMVGAIHADDIAQETFLKAARAMWQLDNDANVRAWLYKIALNCCRDHLRRNCVHNSLTESSSSSPNGTEESAMQREFLGRINRFLLALPRRQREAFTLRRMHGLDYVEIAEAMESSEDAARANVYQAFKKLRGEFAEEIGDLR
jgi:RNA polymerase sigma-70 factor (ECF subfamily)